MTSLQNLPVQFKAQNHDVFDVLERRSAIVEETAGRPVAERLVEVL